jgi:hypothetical protein
MEKYDELSKKIEESHKKMLILLDEIGGFKNIFSNFSEQIETAKTQYNELFKIEKFNDLKKNNDLLLKKMQEDIKKIDENMSIIETYKKLTDEQINIFVKRIHTYEDDHKKMRQAMNDIDNKLSFILTKIDKRENSIFEKSMKVDQLFSANVELQNYSELLKLQKDNNRLLKKLLDLNKINESNNA